jgi:hypothetical protein
MLRTNGHVEESTISGAIRTFSHETHIEIAPGAVQNSWLVKSEISCKRSGVSN